MANRWKSGNWPNISLYYTTTVVVQKWTTWFVTAKLLILHLFSIHLYFIYTYLNRGKIPQNWPKNTPNLPPGENDFLRKKKISAVSIGVIQKKYLQTFFRQGLTALNKKRNSSKTSPKIIKNNSIMCSLPQIN